MSQFLQGRKEVLEYGSLPIHLLAPAVDSGQSLWKLHEKLLASAQVDADGNMFVDGSVVMDCLELTSIQLELLQELLASVSFLNSQDAVAAGSERIFVHEVSLFLFVQLYSREAQRPDNIEVWPETAPTTTEAMSPTKFGSRSPGGIGSRTMVRQQLQQHLKTQLHAIRSYGDYLRRNLSTLLKLVLSDLSDWNAPVESLFMSDKEFNRLAFLIQPCKAAQGSPALCSYVTLFSEHRKVSVDSLLHWLRQHWSEDSLDSPRVSLANGASLTTGPKLSRSQGLVGPSGMVDDSSIQGVMKGTVVRGERDFPGGQLHVMDCHETVIYVLAPLKSVLVTSCSEVTLLLGAVGRVLRVERCDKTTIIAAASRVVISNCHACTFNLGANRPPLLLGDNRFITLAPFNTRYERQVQHLGEVGVRLDVPNRWDAPLVLEKGKERRTSMSTPDSPRTYATSPGTSNPPRTTYSLMAPEEFLPFITPFKGTAGVLAGGVTAQFTQGYAQWRKGPGNLPMYLFPLPPTYERALQTKFSTVSGLRQRLKQCSLEEQRRRELQNVIQAYFKEWLNATNSIRQIYDLSKLESEEAAAGGNSGGSSGGGAVPI